MLQKIVTLLFLSGDPVAFPTLVRIADIEEQALHQLLQDAKKNLEDIGLTLILTEKDAMITTRQEYSAIVEAFRKEELDGDLTPATLQVLTLVAYLPLPTKEQISYIRGVQSAQSIRTLLVRGLIAKQSEGYTLTGEALKHFGVTAKEELPEYQTLSSSFIQKLSSKDNEGSD
jgi:segregation and condensation protein B